MRFLKSAMLLCAVLVMVLAFAPIGVAEVYTPTPMANPVFFEASVLLGTSMVAGFDASLHVVCPSISVSSCILQKQTSNGWVNIGSVPPPTHVAYNTSSYSANRDYSGYCTKGQTYRVMAVFSAGGESVTRYSLGVTYK